MPAPRNRNPGYRTGTILIHLCLLLVALIIVLSPTVQTFQNSDTLLYSLISTQQPTFFYWGQDRLGSFFPLLCSVISNPFANLLVQGILSAYIGLLSFYGIFRLFHNRMTGLFLTAMSAFLLLLAPGRMIFDTLIGYWFYPLSLLALFTAMRLFMIPQRSRPQTAGFLLLLLFVLWINTAVVLVLLAFCAVFLFRLNRKQPATVNGMTRDSVKKMALLISGITVLFVILMRSIAVTEGLRQSNLSPMYPDGWIISWITLLRNSFGYCPACWIALPVSLLYALFRRKHAGSGMKLLSTAGLLFLFLGTFRWIRMNGYNPNYLIPCLLLLISGTTMVLTTGLFTRYRNRILFPVLLLLPLAAVLRFGLPDPKGVRNLFENRWGAPARRILAVGGKVVAGDYWKTWPLAFWSSTLSHETGHGPVYGHTFRGQHTDEYWAGKKDTVFCDTEGNRLKMSVPRTPLKSRRMELICPRKAILVQGTTFLLTIRLRNTGNELWRSARTGRHEIGVACSVNGGNFGKRFPLPHDIPPGETAVCTLEVKHLVKGTNRLRVTMVQGKKDWFRERAEILVIRE